MVFLPFVTFVPQGPNAIASNIAEAGARFPAKLRFKVSSNRAQWCVAFFNSIHYTDRMEEDLEENFNNYRGGHIVTEM